MLLEGATATEVAKALGKGKRTIDRWRASKPFKEALSRVNEQVEQKVVSESSDRIANIKNLALDTIERCLSDPDESMRNKLNAARLAQNLTEPMPIELADPPENAWKLSEIKNFQIGQLEKIARAALRRGDENSLDLGLKILDRIAKISGIDEPLGRSIDNVIRAGYLIQTSQQLEGAEVEALVDRLALGCGYQLPQMSPEEGEELVERVQTLIEEYREEIKNESSDF